VTKYPNSSPRIHCSDEGMFDCIEINDPIVVGDGKTITAHKIGKKKVTVMQKNGDYFEATLTNCKFVPDL